MKTSKWLVLILAVIAFTGFPSEFARAADVPQSFTLDGQLFSDAAATTPLLDGSILMSVKVLDDTKTCILYEETQTLSTLVSQGYFTAQVGTEIGNTRRPVTDSGNSMATVFQNINAINGKLLSNGSPCSTTAGSGKLRYVRITIAPATMGSTARILSPDLTIDSVPNAVVAERAESLQGLRSTDVLKVNTASGMALSQANIESLFTSTTRFNSLTAIVDGTSTNYMRSNSTSGAQLPVLPGAPTTPPIGAIWFDSSDSKIKFQTSVGATVVGAGGGSVTSVGFTAPPELTVAGAPVTSTGTIAVTWAAQTTNKVLAAPDGSTGTPTFRVLTANDIPNLPWTKITSLLPTTLLGYGITDAVKNAGGTPSLQSGLDAGKGAATTAGRIWIATDTKLIYRDNGATWDQIAGASSPTGTAGGDLAGTYPNPSVAKLQGVAVSATAPTNGQILKYGAATWAPGDFSIGDLKTVTGTQQFAGSSNCSASQTLTWSSLTDTFTCMNIAGLDAAAITTGTIASARLPASAAAWTVVGGDVYRSSGMVGIGTSSPGGILDVNGGTAANGTSGLGISLQAQNGGAGNQDGGSIQIVPGNATGSGNHGTVDLGGETTISGNLGVSPTFTVGSSSVVSSVAADSTFNLGTNQTGDIQNISSVAVINPTGPMTVGNVMSYYGQVVHNGLGTTTSAYDFFAANPSRTSGTLSNAYGLYIENINAASVNNYAIYSAGGQSYFAGNVGIGTPAPAYTLDVDGDVNVTGHFKVNGTNLSLSGGGDALTTSPLSQFAATTSAQLAGVISDETGTGALVFGTSPTIATASLSSPTMTGTPIAPSAAADTSTTQVATTAFVIGQASSSAPLINGTAAVGTSLKYARADHVHPTDTTRSPLAGSSSITTVGTVTAGVWNATAIAIANGGTGATTAGVARTNLGLGTSATLDSGNLATNVPVLGTGGISPNKMCTGDAGGTNIICTTTAATGNALTSNPLSQFAATTSAQLAGVMSDETGSGSLVFGTSPTFTTSLFSPMIVGGTDTTSTLTYKTTSGVGATGADHIFLVGSNGGTEAMRILNSGSVGIGNPSPRSALDVTGAITGTASIVNASSTVDFSTGNIQHTTANCGAFSLRNMKDGGSYMFVVKGTTVATCSFTAYSDNGVTALTVHLPPGHGATTTAKHTIYNVAISGGDAYFAWTPGY